jgi:hypothetical protein
MRKLMVLLLALPLLSWAQSPFDGTWKFDTNSVQFPQKPDVIVLKEGMYRCETCVPPINVKADGQWQKVTGQPYMDMMMVKVVDDKHIEQATQKNGRDVGSEKDTLSADGNTINIDWVDKSAQNGKVVTGKTTLKRVAAGPTGSHPTSGSWRAEKVGEMNDEGLLFTYKATPDGMEYSSPTGQSYSAKFNGPDVPMKGDNGNTMISIKKLGPNSFEETSKRDGKLVGVAKVTAEGNKLSFEFNDKQRGTTSRLVANKQ